MSTAAELKDLGNEAFKKSDHETAIELYSQALKTIETSPPVAINSEEAVNRRALSVMLYSNRALCRLKRHDPQQALEDCNQGLKISDKHDKLRYRKALALSALHRPTEALSILRALSTDQYIDEAARKLASEEITRVSIAAAKRAEEVKKVASAATVESTIKTSGVTFQPLGSLAAGSNGSKPSPLVSVSETTSVQLGRADHSSAMQLLQEAMKSQGKLTVDQEKELQSLMTRENSMKSPHSPINQPNQSSNVISTNVTSNVSSTPPNHVTSKKLHGVWASAGGSALSDHLRLTDKLTSKQPPINSSSSSLSSSSSSSSTPSTSCAPRRLLHPLDMPLDQWFSPLPDDGEGTSMPLGRCCVMVNALVFDQDSMLLVKVDKEDEKENGMKDGGKEGKKEGENETNGDRKECRGRLGEGMNENGGDDDEMEVQVDLTEEERRAQANEEEGEEAEVQEKGEVSRLVSPYKKYTWGLLSSSMLPGESIEACAKRIVKTKCLMEGGVIAFTDDDMSVETVAAIEDVPSRCHLLWLRFDVIVNLTKEALIKTGITPTSSPVSPSSSFAWVPRRLIRFGTPLKMSSTDTVNLMEHIPRLNYHSRHVSSTLRFLCPPPLSPLASPPSSLPLSSTPQDDNPSLPLLRTNNTDLPIPPKPASKTMWIGAPLSFPSSPTPSSIPSLSPLSFAHHFVEVASITLPGQMSTPPSVLLVKQLINTHQPSSSLTAAAAAASGCISSPSSSPSPSRYQWVLPATVLRRGESIIFASRRLMRGAFGLVLDDFGCVNVQGGRTVDLNRVHSQIYDELLTKPKASGNGDAAETKGDRRMKREEHVDDVDDLVEVKGEWLDHVPSDQDVSVRGFRFTTATVFEGRQPIQVLRKWKELMKIKHREERKKEGEDVQEEGVEGEKVNEEDENSDDDSSWFPKTLIGGRHMWPAIDKEFLPENIPEHRWANLNDISDLYLSGHLRSDLATLLSVLLRKAEMREYRAAQYNETILSGTLPKEEDLTKGTDVHVADRPSGKIGLGPLGTASLISLDATAIQEDRQHL